MKVLVVEDDANKTKQILEHLETKYKLSCTERRSYQSGLREIFSSEYDLIILDMSLPTFDISSTESGGRYRTYAGREILYQMVRKGKKIKSIVVTQFDSFGEGDKNTTLEELDEELKAMMPEEYLGSVYYNASISIWKENLDSLLSNCMRGTR